MANLNGIIVLNKPKGCTSHDVVAIVKKILNIRKVGHTGTLDPNASGVLPLLLNEGTKISRYLINHDKRYQAIIKLGEKRNTGDLEGRIVQQKEVRTEKLAIENVTKMLNSFIGKQEQVPPIYSAIKVKGKKLYEYARNGEEVEVTARKIEIYEMKLIDVRTECNEITFEVKCSKGTYIRTLCEDIAQRLGTVGYMKDLQRKQVGDFYIEDSITIEQLEKIEIMESEAKSNLLNNYIIPIEKVFDKKEKIELNDKELRLFLNGVMLNYEKKDEVYLIYNNNTFIGLGVIKNKLLKRDMILMK